MKLSMIKRAALRSLVPGWGPEPAYEPGYTVLLPMPMDMPFLLRFALEGLAAIHTPSCRQVVVVPDGWGDDGGAALESVASRFGDPRVQTVRLTALQRRLIRSMKPPGSAATHWMMVVNGTRVARTRHVFLHDADAFFLEPDGLERQYAQCRDAGMFTLGVTARWDPFFTDRDMSIPGTWELMYDNRWARAHHPVELKGAVRRTDAGPYTFDSMLYRQYRDYGTGRVGVMQAPPGFVHFNGTIFTYRLFRDAAGVTVTDEAFRVLLLALLEDLLPPPDGRRVVPTVKELEDGLHDTGAAVSYRGERCAKTYGEFRRQIGEMCGSPIFAGERAERIAALLGGFDNHFGFDPVAPCAPAFEPGRLRMSGLG